MTATVVVNCLQCKDPFRARVSDRKRGWGKFCSKSCKAVRQLQTIPWRGSVDECRPFQMSQADLHAGGYGDKE